MKNLTPSDVFAIVIFLGLIVLAFHDSRGANFKRWKRKVNNPKPKR